MGEHLHTCRDQHGPLSRFRMFAESMDGFVSARFVTTVVVALAGIAIVVGLSQLLQFVA